MKFIGESAIGDRFRSWLISRTVTENYMIFAPNFPINSSGVYCKRQWRISQNPKQNTAFMKCWRNCVTSRFCSRLLKMEMIRIPFCEEYSYLRFFALTEITSFLFLGTSIKFHEIQNRNWRDTDSVQTFKFFGFFISNEFQSITAQFLTCGLSFVLVTSENIFEKMVEKWTQAVWNICTILIILIEEIL